MGDGDKKPNVPTPFRFRRPWEDDEPPPTTSAPLQAHLASSLVPIIRPTPLPALPNQQIIKNEYEASTDCLSALSKLSNMKTEEFEIKPPLEISKSVQIKVEKEESVDSEEIEVFSFDRHKLQLTSEKVRVKRQSTTSNELSTADSSPIDVENLDESSKCSKKSSASSSSMGSGSCSYSLSSSDSDCSSSSDSDDRRKKARRIKIRRNFKKKKLEPRVKREKVKLEEKDDASEEQDENEIHDSEAEEEEDEEDGSDSDSRMRLDEFPEGRNKERKNSRWADYGVTRKSNRLRSTKTKFCNKAHKAQVLKRLTSLLKKDPEELGEDDKVNLAAFPELAKEARKRLEKRHLASERMKEEEDPADILDAKCTRLAQMITKANYVVLYTGAGISTSALIPDYRGPNGIWTLLRKGQSIADDLKQFPQSADPTLTHMAIKKLYDNGVIKHIVSQNVDGLHLRSGIPKTALSEVHGNMYIEVCLECHREYVRLFDVTENTKRHHHKTGRSCYHCGAALKDSVVLFGEKGSLRWPINWAGAEYNVDKADVILCLGSSLKVLRRYPWLWSLSKPAKQRPELCIVNLQWTPKDRFATLKINGRCDEVISKVMDKLKISVPEYKRELDPIFSIATLLHPTESSTRRSKDLTLPEGIVFPSKSTDLQNYVKFEPVFCKEVRALNQVKRKVVDGEVEEKIKKDTNSNPNKSCGIGWLGNALSVKPKKKKLK